MPSTPDHEEGSPPPSDTRRRPSRRRRFAIAALALLLLAAAAGLWLLETKSGRGFLLARILPSIESSTGLDLEVGSWRLSLLRGEILLEDVEVRNQGELLARLPRTTARVQYFSLLRRRPVLESLSLERPFVDLAHLPEPKPADDEPAGPPLEFRLDSLTLSDGEVRGVVAEPSSPLQSYELSGLDASGSARGGVDSFFEVDASATLLARGPQLRDAPVDVALQTSGGLSGPWTLETLRATADGLDLTASASVAAEPVAPAALQFRLRAEPDKLLVLDAAGAELDAEADLDLAQRSGSLRARLVGTPLDLFLAQALPQTGAEVEAASRYTVATDTELRIEPDRAGSFSIAGRAGAQLLEGTEARASFEGSLSATREGTSVWVPSRTADARGELTVDSLRLADFLQLLPEDARSSVELTFREPRLDGSWTLSTIGGDPRLSSGGRVTLTDGPLQIAAALRDASFQLDNNAPDMGTLRGDADLDLTGLDPGPLVAAWLPESEPEQAAGQTTNLVRDALRAGDEIGAAVRLRISGGKVSLRGPQSANWTDPDGETLLRMAAAADSAQAVTLGVELFPETSESVNLQATAQQSSLDLADLERSIARLRSAPLEGRLTSDETSVAALVARIERRIPALAEVIAPYRPAVRGTLSVDARVAGTTGDPSTESRLRWDLTDAPQLDDEGSIRGFRTVPPTFTAELSGRPLSAEWQGNAELEARDLSWLAPFLEELDAASQGAVPAEAEAEPSPLAGLSGSSRLTVTAEAGDGLLQLRAVADAWPLSVTAAPNLRRVSFDLAQELVLLAERPFEPQLQEPLQVSSVRIGVDDAVLQMSGTVDAADLSEPPRLVLALETRGSAYGIERLAGDLLSGADGVRLDLERVETSRGGGQLALDVPWQALRDVAGLEALAEQLDRWGVPASPQPATLTAQLDGVLLRSEAPLEGPPPRIAAAEDVEPTATFQADRVDVQLSIRPSAPSDSSGSVSIDRLAIRQGEIAADAAGLELTLADRRISLAPLEVLTNDQVLEARAEVDLAPWTTGAPLTELVTDVRASAAGTVDSSLLNSFLAGGRANGPVTVDVSMAGPVDGLRGTLVIDAPDAVIRFQEPYATELSKLRMNGQLASGALTIESATANLNRGTLELAGALGPEAVDLGIQLDGIRYRVDYGLSTQLSGDLRLQLDPETFEGELSGEASLERGLLRRSIDLEREALAFLRPAGSSLSAPDPLTQGMELDLLVSTRNGVRVRNNVADLTVGWSPIRVRGTLAQPLIDGVLDVESGGLVSLYGQTVRLDQATVTLTGQPGAPPSFDLVTTTSLEDPSITRNAREDLDPFAPRDDNDQESKAGADQVAGGLAQYVGDRLLGSAGQQGVAIGNAFSVRPVLVLTESEPSAHLLVTRALTEQLDVGASFNMRNAEDRTYLLDLHDLRGLPTLAAQVFTNEEANEGATVQQVLQLGRNGQERLRVGRVEVTLEDGDREGAPKPKRLARASGVRRSDVWEEGLLFDIEIDVEETIRRRGFPSPRVEVTQSQRGGRIDVAIQAELGPKARIEFRGLEPPSRLRGPIRLLYRSDFYEAASLDEMERQVATALRGEGWLEPSVVASVTDAATGEDVDRVVTVEASAEQRLRSPDLELIGLPEDVTERLREDLASRANLAALASGDDEALEAVTQKVRSLGWRAAAPPSVAVDFEEEVVALSFEPGERSQVQSVGLEGDGDRDELLAAAELDAGDPFDQDEIVTAALRIQSHLDQRGYRDARVTANTTPSSDSPSTREDVDVVFDVVAGPRYFVDEVAVTSDGRTDAGWAVKVADMDLGSQLDASLMADGRRRLLSTGVFDTVYLQTQKQPDGSVRLGVELDERPRWTLGYGLRWESDEGLGVVVDALDRNLFGRGVQFGARALYTDRRQAFRLYSTLPRVLGSLYSLEFFSEVRSEDDDVFLTDTFESSLQLSRPLSRFGSGRAYARYREQRVTDDNTFLPIDDRIKNPFVGLQYIWDNRADVLGGSGGLLASADLSGSGSALGSSFSYVRFFGQLQYTRNAFSLGGRRVRWAQSYRLGLADAGSQSLDSRLRFFAGGEYSVRGYRTESLGPIEDLGTVVIQRGGEALFVINQELRFPIFWKIGGVVFWDAGEVWAQVSELETDLRHSLGLGLRYRSPVGLLRLDVGFPINPRDGDPSYRVYAGLGQVF